MGGAVRHLTNFLPELIKQNTHHEFTVLARKSLIGLPAKNGQIRFERVEDSQVSQWPSRVAYDLFKLPSRMKREKFDAVVSLTNFGPVWSPSPHIIFQRNSLYYCPYYLSRVKGKEKLEVLLRRRLALESMKRAKLIVTPSHAMRDMIKRSCPEVAGRSFRTLYHGVDRDFLEEPLDAKVEAQLPKDGYLLLYPTHPASHKGFEILFEALASLKKRRGDFTFLTTISRDDWPAGFEQYERFVSDLGLQKNVIFLGRIPQRQMGALYQKCHLMVYPSLCESFGFSMPEAMASGLPIVAAGTETNREICADAAVYYSSQDPQAAADVMERTLNPAALKQMAERGRERLNSFDWSWARYAREFVKIVEEVAAQ